MIKLLTQYGKQPGRHLTEKNMKILSLFSIVLCFVYCNNFPGQTASFNYAKNVITADAAYTIGSWQYFLQHLPVKDAPIVDYRGRPVANQSKHVSIINYDVGTKDLQQCADALMRLRAEYLFSINKSEAIGFHFCSGLYYSWDDYCRGARPIASGNRVSLYYTKATEKTHQSLRSYLDIVYAYANTISLCKELKATDKFEVGTVIITPGSPGHTCIVIDESSDTNGEKIYKLAEGYMPAQSIYIVSNPYEPQISPWYHLKKGVIEIASYTFSNYVLRKFE